MQNKKTDLCDREISRGAHQTFDNTGVRNSGFTLQSSTKKADTQQT